MLLFAKEKNVKIRLKLPAASLCKYAFSADDNWFEFSNAIQTFLMCGGISSKISGSHNGGLFVESLLHVTFVNVSAIIAINTMTSDW